MSNKKKLELLLNIINDIRHDSDEWKSHGILDRIMSEYNQSLEDTRQIKSKLGYSRIGLKNV